MAPYGPTPIIQTCSDNSSCSHTENLTLSLYILHMGVSQTLRFQNLSVSYMCPCFLIHHFQGSLRGKNDFGTSPIHSGKWTAGTPSLRFGRWPSFSRVILRFHVDFQGRNLFKDKIQTVPLGHEMFLLRGKWNSIQNLCYTGPTSVLEPNINVI